MRSYIILKFKIGCVYKAPVWKSGYNYKITNAGFKVSYNTSMSFVSDL